MKAQEFRKLIREEIKKVLKEAKEAKLEKSVYNDVNVNERTADEFIILDMIPGTDGLYTLINTLAKQKVASCDVKSGSIDSGYKGFKVTVTLASGNQIKLFIDKDEFKGTKLLSTLKTMTTNPNGKLLAAAIKLATE